MNEVDLLAVMKKVNPEVYRDWDIESALIEDPWNSNPDVSYIRRFHLHLQEDMVVVGVKILNKAKHMKQSRIDPCPRLCSYET